MNGSWRDPGVRFATNSLAILCAAMFFCASDPHDVSWAAHEVVANKAIAAGSLAACGILGLAIASRWTTGLLGAGLCVAVFATADLGRWNDRSAVIFAVSHCASSAVLFRLSARWWRPARNSSATGRRGGWQVVLGILGVGLLAAAIVMSRDDSWYGNLGEDLLAAVASAIVCAFASTILMRIMLHGARWVVIAVLALAVLGGLEFARGFYWNMLRDLTHWSTFLMAAWALALICLGLRCAEGWPNRACEPTESPATERRFRPDVSWTLAPLLSAVVWLAQPPKATPPEGQFEWKRHVLRCDAIEVGVRIQVADSRSVLGPESRLMNLGREYVEDPPLLELVGEGIDLDLVRRLASRRRGPIVLRDTTITASELALLRRDFPEVAFAVEWLVH